MADQPCKPVEVSRRISAPADALFGYLTHPANHVTIDGSGMLRSAVGGTRITGVGDEFAVAMHNDEMGDYEITNLVVEFEPNKRIGWEPVLTRASRAEDQSAVGDRAGHRWSFAFTPEGDDRTVVTEIYDCTSAPEWLRRVLNNGNRWIGSMTDTLVKLDAVARDGGLHVDG